MYYFILFIKLKFNFYRSILIIGISTSTLIIGQFSRTFNLYINTNSFQPSNTRFWTSTTNSSLTSNNILVIKLHKKRLFNHNLFLDNIVFMASFTFTDPSSSLELLTIINSIHNLSITSTKEQVVIFNGVEPSRSNFISNRLQAGYGRLK